MKSSHCIKMRFGIVAILVALGVTAAFRHSAKSEAVYSAPQPHLDVNSPLAQTAARVFHGQSCAGYHYLTGIWGYQGLPLDQAADKYNAENLKRYIRDSRSVNHRALMPPQTKVTDDEIDAIVAFLAGLPRPQTNSLESYEHR